MRSIVLGPTVAVFLASAGSSSAAPWIQQNRWMVLGPLNNGSCYPDIHNPPLSSHDVAGECPKVRDDWKGQELWITGANTAWQDLEELGLGPGDVLDFASFYGGGGLQTEYAKALAVIYAVNTTPNPIQVDVCTASDDSIAVWINDRIVTSVADCRGVLCDCAEVNPGVLVPGKNRIAVCVWNGFFGWGFRLRLMRTDGSVIDDSNDPEVEFTLDPEGCLGGLSPLRIVRDIEGNPSECPGSDGRAVVKLIGEGGGDLQERITVREIIRGQATPVSISSGGVFTPAVREEPCPTEGRLPVGVFEDHRDIGNPCAAGNTVYAPETERYAVTGAGEDIWQCGDRFQFAHRTLSGNFAVTARIARRDWKGAFPPSRWGKFGLMAREDCTEKGRYAFIRDVSLNSDPPVPDSAPSDPDALCFAGRHTRGTADDFEAGPNPTKGCLGIGGVQHPDYLKIERSGNEFFGYASTDGSHWTLVDSIDWGRGAPCSVMVGLAVTSHSDCIPITIEFDQVHIEGGDAECPSDRPGGGTIVWQNIERSRVREGLRYEIEDGLGLIQFSGNDGLHPIVGASFSPIAEGDWAIELNPRPLNPVGPHFEDATDFGWTRTYGGGAKGGLTTYDPKTDIYTQRGSGYDFWIEGDSSHFAYKKLASDFDITVEVVDREDPEGQWGRHGLLARRDCSGNSRYTLLFENLGNDAQDEEPGMFTRVVHGMNTSLRDYRFFDFHADKRPDFMKLIRIESSFYGFLSKDGKDWLPMGFETWQEQDPGEPILVGFTTQDHGSLDPPPVVKFRVLNFGPAQHPIPGPLPEDGLVPRCIHFTGFDTLAQWQVQHGAGDFDPEVRQGRLRMIDGEKFSNATSAFYREAISGIDDGVYQFDFDLRLEKLRTGGPSFDIPADGLTFAVLSGRDPTRVGEAGGSMGYQGIAVDPSPDPTLKGRNIGTNSFAVEFDTWSETSRWSSTNEGAGGPSLAGRYHVGIDAANMVSSIVQTSDGLPEIFSPEGIHARVRYNRGLVQVFLAPGGMNVDGLKKVLETRVLPLSHLAPDGSAVFGFTAATGAAAMTAEVDNFSAVWFGTPNWIRCDVNGDKARDLSDPIFLLGMLFTGGGESECIGAGDCNSDGAVDITDAIFDLNFQFLGGRAPAAPYPDCDLFPGCPDRCE